MYFKRLTLLSMFLMVFLGYAQDEPENDLSNIQEFTPSKLLSKGQWDIKFFNGLYTQTERSDDGSTSVTIPRETFFTNTTEIYTGVSQNSRINVGLIIQVRSNTLGGQGALEVFKFEDNNSDARAGFTTIAPSIRIQPFASMPTFSLTSSFYFPVFEDRGLPGQFNDPPYLDKRSYFWETRFFYDKTFGDDKWQIFTEIDFGFNFGEKGEDADFNTENVSERFANNSLFMPLSAFLSYFVSPQSTFYINGKQSFLFDLGNGFAQNGTSFGIGTKYQITQVLNIEASFDKFVRGRNFQGLGQTFSLGLRAIF